MSQVIGSARSWRHEFEFETIFSEQVRRTAAGQNMAGVCRTRRAAVGADVRSCTIQVARLILLDDVPGVVDVGSSDRR